MGGIEVNVRKGLVVGILGGFLVALGCFISNATPQHYEYPGVATVDFFAGATSKSTIELLFATAIVIIGMILTGLGYFSINRHFQSRNCKLCKLNIFIILLTTIAGSLTMVSCTLATITYNNNYEKDFHMAISFTEKFVYSYLLPDLIAFLVAYAIEAIYITAVCGIGRTDFSRFAGIFNVVMPMVVMYIIVPYFPDNPIGNGMTVTGLGLGYMFTFAGFLLTMRTNKRTDNKM